MISSLLFSLLGAMAPSAASSKLHISPCEAGEHFQFSIVECDIELRNTGDRPIIVSKGEARFTWDRIEASPVTVPPKGTAYIKTHIDLRNDEGAVRRPFRFETDEPGQQMRGSEVRAYAISILDQSRPVLDFGVVRMGEPLESKAMRFSSREAVGFRINGVASKPDWLEVILDKDGLGFVASLKDSVPWGLTHHGSSYLKLNVNAPQQSQVWIDIEVNALGEIVPDSNPLQLGVIRDESKHEYLLRLTSRSGKDFDTGAPQIEAIKAKAKIEACVPAATGCRLLRVEVDNDQPLGKLEGIIKIPLPMQQRTLPIEVVGMLLSSETKIHKMDDLLKQATEKGAGVSTVAQSGDIGEAIKNTLRGELPPPPGNGPLLRWSVAHQSGIYGYAIYRSNLESGPFLRVNKDLLQVSAEGSDSSGSYQWRDNTAESGKTYWYRIGILDRNGAKRDLTGSQKVTAK